MTKQEPRSNGSPVNLAERLENLTSKRQEIIRPILENPREYVLLSVRAMAKRLNTDPATIVRIVRGLGFPSYRDFQHHLHALSIAFASPLDSMMSTPGDSSISAVIQESLTRSAKNLQALKNSLDTVRLSKVAKRLYDARRVIAFAADSAAILAEYLEYHLSIVGVPIVAVTSAGGMTHLPRVVTKRDVVIAISFQRGLRQTVEGAQQARAHGAYCIGVSDTYLSPLARVCDEIFIASVETTSFSRSYAAPIALMDAIVATCLQYKRPLAIAVAKEIAEEQKKGVRWYNG
jgi:RpiR family transcriptional regulator, carbohydrate utilization regulator